WVTTHCDEGVGRFRVRLGMVVSDFDVKSRGSAFDQRVDEALSQSGAEAKIVNGDMNGRFCSGYELGQLLSDRPRLTRIAPMSGVSQKGYPAIFADILQFRARVLVRLGSTSVYGPTGRCANTAVPALCPAGGIAWDEERAPLPHELRGSLVAGR